MMLFFVETYQTNRINTNNLIQHYNTRSIIKHGKKKA